jgi:hypothetical protein
MSKEMRLAIISFPLAFLPGLLTALFHDVLIKPSIWWGFLSTFARHGATRFRARWATRAGDAGGILGGNVGDDGHASSGDCVGKRLLSSGQRSVRAEACASDDDNVRAVG